MSFLVENYARKLLYLVLAAEDLLLVESDASDFFDPVLVVGHPHVDSGQVGIGTLDTVTHCPHQYPPKINPQHQCVILVVFNTKLATKNNIFPDRVADPNPHYFVLSLSCRIGRGLSQWRHVSSK
jgi:hypothetical protein